MTNMIADEAVAKSNVLSVFDFDGTLTHHDSFIPFLRFAFGKRYFAGRLVRMSSKWRNVLCYICLLAWIYIPGFYSCLL